MRIQTRLYISILVSVLIGVGAVVVIDQLVGDEPAVTSPHEHGDGEFDIHGPQPANATPDVAAQMALTAMFSWQPVTDASPGAGLTRAKEWLTGNLAAEANAPAATGIRQLPDWEAWRASRDVIRAQVSIDGQTGPEDGQCLVTATVTQTVLHTDGTQTRYGQPFTVSAAVTDSGHGWRMASYRAVQ